tara:strand:- start:105537 stop:106115 length:579 start_codon:yes stop_codon:yes gene_type:complete
MIKWIALLVALVGALGGLLWKLSAPSDEPEVIVPTFDAAGATSEPSIVAKRRTTTGPQSDAAPAALAEGVLDPQGEEFSARLDVGIPDRFRASLASCNRKDFDPDAKISLTYTLNIADGQVSASNVQVDKSDLGDPELERCMVQAVQEARWEARDLPDFSEEQDLFIRIRSLDKYLSKDEQESNKAGANRTE